MSSKSFIKKSFAMLLAVLFTVSAFAITSFAGMADPKVKVEYDDGIVSILFPASKLNEMVENKSLTLEGIKDLLPQDMKDAWKANRLAGVLTCDTVTSAVKFADIIKLVPASVYKEAITADEVIKTVDVKKVIEDGNIDVDKLLNSVTEADVLAAMKTNYASKAEAIAAIKAAVTSHTDISTVVDVKSAVTAVVNSTDGVAAVVDSIEDSALTSVVSSISKSQMVKDVVNVVVEILNGKTVKLNGDVIATNGQISGSAAEKAVIKLIPTPSKIKTCASNNGVIFEAVLEATLQNNETLKIGFKAGVYGDAAELATFESNATTVIDKVNQYIKNVTFDGEETITLDVVVPKKISKAFVKALESDKLSDDTKATLVAITNGTIDDAIEYLKSIEIDQIQAFYDSIADQIENYNETLGSVLERLMELSESKQNYVEVLRSLILTVLDNVEDEDKAKSFADLYQGNAVFDVEIGSGLLVKDIIDAAATLFPQAASLANHVNVNATLGATVIANVTFNDLHQVRFCDSHGNVIFTSYLPEGAPFADIIANTDELDDGDTWYLADSTVIDTMPAEDVSVYNHILEVYQVNFHHFDETVTVVYYIEDTTALDPALVPNPDVLLGYDTWWEDYNSLLNTAPEVDVYLVLEKLREDDYAIIFVYPDGSRKYVWYTPDENVTVLSKNKYPPVPEIEGYSVEWGKAKLNLSKYFKVHCILTPLDYSVKFVQEDGSETVVSYKYGTLSIVEPKVKDKTGYIGSWESYKLNEAKEVVVHAVYKADGWAVNFKQENGKVTTVTYKYGDKSVKEPAVDTKDGYVGKWESYELNKQKEITVNAVYTPETWQIVFVVDNQVFKTVEYTYGAKSIDVPAVPEKTGYTGEWEEFVLNFCESFTVNAKYAAKTYKVTFVAGDFTKTVEYTYGATSIEAPAVPEVEGKVGVWEAYELNKAESITVNAIYEDVPEEKTSLWWLWTSLGVVGVGAAALITFLTKKKKDDDNNETK